VTDTQTDGRTDGHRMTRHRPRLHSIARQKLHGRQCTAELAHCTVHSEMQNITLKFSFSFWTNWTRPANSCKFSDRTRPDTTRPGPPECPTRGSGQESCNSDVLTSLQSCYGLLVYRPTPISYSLTIGLHTISLAVLCTTAAMM